MENIALKRLEEMKEILGSDRLIKEIGHSLDEEELQHILDYIEEWGRA